MPKKKKTQPINQIERDFFDAIERLENKCPTHPELQKVAKKGKLKTNKRTVAKEAGHSRTTLDEYPRIVNRLKELESEESQQTRTSHDLINNLREEKEQLKNDKRLLASQLAAMAIKMDKQAKTHKAEIDFLKRSKKILTM